MDIEQVKNIISGWASTEPLVTKVYIFGSRARDDFRHDSDIDIAIEIKKQPGDSNTLATWMFESKGLKKRLSPLLPYTLQLENIDGNKTPVVSNGVSQSSILVYDEKSTLLEAQ